MIVVENIRPGAVFLPNRQMLLPGENGVKEEDWEMFKTNPGVKQLLDNGFLIDKGKGKPQPILDQIDKLSVEKALKYVAHTKDPNLVRRWKMKEKRSTVKKAIDKRMEQLKEEVEELSG